MHSPTSKVTAAKRNKDLLFPIFAQTFKVGVKNRTEQNWEQWALSLYYYSRDRHVTDMPLIWEVYPI